MDWFAISLRALAHKDEIEELWRDAKPAIDLVLKTFPIVKPRFMALFAAILPELTHPTDQGVVASYDVFWLQRSLNKLELGPLTIDGDYGPATRAAVRKFQAAHGLAVDGWCGITTTSKLIVELDRRLNG